MKGNICSEARTQGEESFPQVPVVKRSAIVIAPTIFPPRSSSRGILMDVLGVRNELHTSPSQPAGLRNYPFDGSIPRQEFHSVDTAFRNATVHDLLNLTLPIIWIVNNRCTAGQPSRVLVAGAVGKDFHGMWIKDHRFVTAFPDPILADNPAKENANDL
jgi:hypothetical protein